MPVIFGVVVAVVAVAALASWWDGQTPNTETGLDDVGDPLTHAVGEEDVANAAEPYTGSRTLALTPNFRLNEFVVSSSFPGLLEGVWEYMTVVHVDRLIRLAAAVLQPTRTAIDAPIRIGSGLRSPELNGALTGSSPTSQHMRGEAADLSPPSGMTALQLADAIMEAAEGWDQLIVYSTFVHVSWKQTGNRNEVRYHTPAAPYELAANGGREKYIAAFAA